MAGDPVAWNTLAFLKQSGGMDQDFLDVLHTVRDQLIAGVGEVAGLSIGIQSEIYDRLGLDQFADAGRGGQQAIDRWSDKQREAGLTRGQQNIATAGQLYEMGTDVALAVATGGASFTKTAATLGGKQLRGAALVNQMLGRSTKVSKAADAFANSRTFGRIQAFAPSAARVATEEVLLLTKEYAKTGEITATDLLVFTGFFGALEVLIEGGLRARRLGRAFDDQKAATDFQETVDDLKDEAVPEDIQEAVEKMEVIPVSEDLANNLKDAGIEPTNIKVVKTKPIPDDQDLSNVPALIDKFGFDQVIQKYATDLEQIKETDRPTIKLRTRAAAQELLDKRAELQQKVDKLPAGEFKDKVQAAVDQKIGDLRDALVEMDQNTIKKLPVEQRLDLEVAAYNHDGVSSNAGIIRKIYEADYANPRGEFYDDPDKIGMKWFTRQGDKFHDELHRLGFKGVKDIRKNVEKIRAMTEPVIDKFEKKYAKYLQWSRDDAGQPLRGKHRLITASDRVPADKRPLIKKYLEALYVYRADLKLFDEMNKVDPLPVEIEGKVVAAKPKIKTTADSAKAEPEAKEPEPELVGKEVKVKFVKRPKVERGQYKTQDEFIYKDHTQPADDYTWATFLTYFGRLRKSDVLKQVAELKPTAEDLDRALKASKYGTDKASDISKILGITEDKYKKWRREVRRAGRNDLLTIFGVDNPRLNMGGIQIGNVAIQRIGRRLEDALATKPAKPKTEPAPEKAAVSDKAEPPTTAVSDKKEPDLRPISDKHAGKSVAELQKERDALYEEYKFQAKERTGIDLDITDAKLKRLPDDLNRSTFEGIRHEFGLKDASFARLINQQWLKENPPAGKAKTRPEIEEAPYKTTSSRISAALTKVRKEWQADMQTKFKEMGTRQDGTLDFRRVSLKRFEASRKEWKPRFAAAIEALWEKWYAPLLDYGRQLARQLGEDFTFKFDGDGVLTEAQGSLGYKIHSDDWHQLGKLERYVDDLEARVAKLSKSDSEPVTTKKEAKTDVETELTREAAQSARVDAETQEWLDKLRAKTKAKYEDTPLEEIPWRDFYDIYPEQLKAVRTKYQAPEEPDYASLISFTNKVKRALLPIKKAYRDRAVLSGSDKYQQDFLQTLTDLRLKQMEPEIEYTKRLAKALGEKFDWKPADDFLEEHNILSRSTHHIFEVDWERLIYTRRGSDLIDLTRTLEQRVAIKEGGLTKAKEPEPAPIKKTGRFVGPKIEDFGQPPYGDLTDAQIQKFNKASWDQDMEFNDYERQELDKVTIRLKNKGVKNIYGSAEWKQAQEDLATRRAEQRADLLAEHGLEEDPRLREAERRKEWVKAHDTAVEDWIKAETASRQAELKANPITAAEIKKSDFWTKGETSGINRLWGIAYTGAGAARPFKKFSYKLDAYAKSPRILGNNYSIFGEWVRKKGLKQSDQFTADQAAELLADYRQFALDRHLADTKTKLLRRVGWRPAISSSWQPFRDEMSVQRLADDPHFPDFGGQADDNLIVNRIIENRHYQDIFRAIGQQDFTPGHLEALLKRVVRNDLQHADIVAGLKRLGAPDQIRPFSDSFANTILPIDGVARLIASDAELFKQYSSLKFDDMPTEYNWLKEQLIRHKQLSTRYLNAAANRVGLTDDVGQPIVGIEGVQGFLNRAGKLLEDVKTTHADVLDKVEKIDVGMVKAIINNEGIIDLLRFYGEDGLASFYEYQIKNKGVLYALAKGGKVNKLKAAYAFADQTKAFSRPLAWVIEQAQKGTKSVRKLSKIVHPAQQASDIRRWINDWRLDEFPGIDELRASISTQSDNEVLAEMVAVTKDYHARLERYIPINREHHIWDELNPNVRVVGKKFEELDPEDFIHIGKVEPEDLNIREGAVVMDDFKFFGRDPNRKFPDIGPNNARLAEANHLDVSLTWMPIKIDGKAKLIITEVSLVRNPGRALLGVFRPGAVDPRKVAMLGLRAEDAGQRYEQTDGDPTLFSNKMLLPYPAPNDEVLDLQRKISKLTSEIGDAKPTRKQQAELTKLENRLIVEQQLQRKFYQEAFNPPRANQRLRLNSLHRRTDLAKIDADRELYESLKKYVKDDVPPFPDVPEHLKESDDGLNVLRLREIEHDGFDLLQELKDQIPPAVKARSDYQALNDKWRKRVQPTYDLLDRFDDRRKIGERFERETKLVKPPTKEEFLEYFKDVPPMVSPKPGAVAKTTSGLPQHTLPQQAVARWLNDTAVINIEYFPGHSLDRLYEFLSETGGDLVRRIVDKRWDNDFTLMDYYQKWLRKKFSGYEASALDARLTMKRWGDVASEADLPLFDNTDNLRIFHDLDMDFTPDLVNPQQLGDAIRALKTTDQHIEDLMDGVKDFDNLTLWEEYLEGHIDLVDALRLLDKPFIRGSLETDNNQIAFINKFKEEMGIPQTPESGTIKKDVGQQVMLNAEDKEFADRFRQADLKEASPKTDQLIIDLRDIDADRTLSIALYNSNFNTFTTEQQNIIMDRLRKADRFNKKSKSAKEAAADLTDPALNSLAGTGNPRVVQRVLKEVGDFRLSQGDQTGQALKALGHMYATRAGRELKTQQLGDLFGGAASRSQRQSTFKDAFSDKGLPNTTKIQIQSGNAELTQAFEGKSLNSIPKRFRNRLRQDENGNVNFSAIGESFFDNQNKWLKKQVYDKYGDQLPYRADGSLDEWAINNYPAFNEVKNAIEAYQSRTIQFMNDVTPIDNKPLQGWRHANDAIISGMLSFLGTWTKVFSGTALTRFIATFTVSRLMRVAESGLSREVARQIRGYKNHFYYQMDHLRNNIIHGMKHLKALRKTALRGEAFTAELPSVLQDQNIALYRNRFLDYSIGLNSHVVGTVLNNLDKDLTRGFRAEVMRRKIQGIWKGSKSLLNQTLDDITNLFGDARMDLNEVLKTHKRLNDTLEDQVIKHFPDYSKPEIQNELNKLYVEIVQEAQSVKLADNDAFFGWVGKIGGFIRQYNLGSFVPFVRTSLLAAWWTAELTPALGAVKTGAEYKWLAKKGKKFAASSRERKWRMLDRQTYAFALASIGFVLAANDMMTGAYPTEKHEQEKWKAEGKQPFALRLPWSDEWMNWDILNIFGGGAGMGASGYENLLDQTKDLPTKVRDFILNSASKATFALGETAFMPLIEHAERIWRPRNENTQAQEVENMWTDWLSRLIPGSVKGLSRVMDPSSKAPGTWAEKAFWQHLPWTRGNVLDQKKFGQTTEQNAILSNVGVRMSTPIKRDNLLAEEIIKMTGDDSIAKRRLTEGEVTFGSLVSALGGDNYDGDNGLTFEQRDQLHAGLRKARSERDIQELSNIVSDEFYRLGTAFIKTDRYQEASVDDRLAYLTDIKNLVRNSQIKDFLIDSGLGRYITPLTVRQQDYIDGKSVTYKRGAAETPHEKKADLEYKKRTAAAEDIPDIERQIAVQTVNIKWYDRGETEVLDAYNLPSKLRLAEKLNVIYHRDGPTASRDFYRKLLAYSTERQRAVPKLDVKWVNFDKYGNIVPSSPPEDWILYEAFARNRATSYPRFRYRTPSLRGMPSFERYYLR